MASTGRPITSHPAFAPLVGLWFAALLGGGLLVMPYSIHDAIAASTRLDTLVAAGSTTRIAISVAGALLGLLIGIAIAARIARGNDVFEESGEDAWEDERIEPAVEDAAPPADSVWLGERAAPAPDPAQPPVIDEEPVRRRRMFNPREELGEDGIASAAPPLDTALEPSAISALMEEWQASVGHDEDPVKDEAGERVDVASPVPQVIEDADFEEATDEPLAAPPVASEPRAALGDLSLGELTERLAAALARSKAHPPAATGAYTEAEPAAVEDEPDPVIAFLRREADRGGAARGSGADDADPQKSLRNALERLSQVRNPQ